MKKSAIILGWAIALAVPAFGADDLVNEALVSFPARTIRLEMTDAARLRELSDYATLRAHYMAPNLRHLEEYLSKLGIQERDIDQVVLGWQSTDEGLKLTGLAAGHFDPVRIAQRAAAQGLRSSPIEGQPSYCFGAEAQSVCLVVISPTLGAFGPLSSLDQMLLARGGQAPSLQANPGFSALVRQGRRYVPIWGVATGPAIVDWFKGWMPAQKSLQLNWSAAFQNVEWVDYHVEPADQVELGIDLHCMTPAAATSLRQVFDGLRMFQQLAWQQQNPGAANPFQNLVIDASNREVTLHLTAAYATLEHGIPAQ